MFTIMSTGRSPHLLFMLIVLFSLLSAKAVSGFNSRMEDDRIIKCIERERHALLMIKQSFVDDYGRLSSWGPEDDKKDCCKWQGVSCSNRTGHVVKLDLHGSYGYVDGFGPKLNSLRGNLSSSILELRQLNYLTLRLHDFGGQPIPEFIGSLTNLRHLDLSSSGFGGQIPYQLGNLSRLQSLDLSADYNSGMYAGKLEWLSRLPFLRHLGLNEVNLSQAVDWLQVISELPSLTEVQLCFCNLPSVTSLSSISFVNSSKSLSLLQLYENDASNSIYLWLSNFSSSLVDLALSSSKLQGPIPEFVFSNMKALQYLDLSSNKLHGLIPKYAFSNMTSLQELHLYDNQIDGMSPEAFTNTCNLKSLSLFSNNITGQLSDLVFNLPNCIKHSLEFWPLFQNMLGGSLPDFSEFISLKELEIWNNQLNAITPKSIGQLFKLELLDISSNPLEGTIIDAHMSNLPQLKHLDLSSTLLTVNFTSGWVPPFQLEIIALRACKLGPHFPKWLLTLRNYLELDISNTGISDTIPTQFWKLSPNLNFLNLSYNHMRGILPDLSSKFVNNLGLDLSFNDFEGPIPLFPSHVTSLSLSQNKFSGSISFLCSISGPFFNYLDLSNNLLSGELPNCSWPIENLVVLNLANNHFSGEFPNMMGPKCSLEMLKLHKNHFIGELPPSFNMCNELKIFDVGDNKFSGTIPLWIGESLPNLIILDLRSNQFNGTIPLQLCKLSYLQLVDLSLNNISGTIPKCLNNLTAMVQRSSVQSTTYIKYIKYLSPGSGYGHQDIYENAAVIMWKGKDREYKENLGYLKCIDLSSNKLYGAIPVEITSLEGLRSLNLSRNSLTGSITTKISNLTLLDSLDLSNNELIGEIPPSFSLLTFLGVLDLSNNNLSGKIPVDTVLLTFDALAYMGNPNLCGPPLPKCLETEVPAVITQENTNDDVIVTPEFYICLAIGFIVGFWGVLGSLLLNKSWRHAYFQFLNHATDRLYIAMVLNIAKLQRWPITRR